MASVVSAPHSTGSGQYNYDGSALTISGATVSQIIYSWSPFDLATSDPVLGADIVVTGLTYTGGTGPGGSTPPYGFTNGQLKLTDGDFDYLTAEIVDVELIPTSENTAYINEGTTVANLVNVVVNDPTPSTYDFVDYWEDASQGATYGAFGFTLENGASGSVSPELVAPAAGSVSFTLQPATTPEPSSVLLLLLGGGVAFRRRQTRKG
jgi:hypothetical protein